VSDARVVTGGTRLTRRLQSGHDGSTTSRRNTTPRRSSLAGNVFCHIAYARLVMP
jgi:hypothetical protein